MAFHRMDSRRRVFGILIMLLFATTARAAVGDLTPTGTPFGYGSPYNNTENADFRYSIPIEAPGYLDAEPALSLNYSSSSGNGVLGMGWSLGGIRMIERFSPGKGAPKYDGNDTYYLDGVELLPCSTPNSSVSCAYGGTHFTKVENFERVTLNSSPLEWRIHGKDGSLLILRSLANPARIWVPFASVNRNSVQTDYSWGNITAANTQPALLSIAYGPSGLNRITFTYETRSDPIVSAVGTPSPMSNGLRLTQIVVQSNGWIRRGYKLTYRNDLEYTGVSMLTRVQAYGSDLTYNANGLIAGGSVLPATTIGWQGDSHSIGLQGAANGPGYPAVVNGASGFSTIGSQRWLVDMDGDGRLDLVRKDNGNTLYWALSNGGGWDAIRSQSAGIHGNGTLRWMADINGDGKADYVTKTSDDNIHYNLVQDRFSFASGVTQNIGMGIGNVNATWMIDVNGDGYSDYVTHVVGPTQQTCFVYTLGGPTGFGPRRDDCSGIHGLGSYRWWADINGDGALDYNAKNQDGNHYWNLFDRKTGRFLPGQSQSGMHTQGSLIRTMADINGDGKADYVVKNTDGCIYWNLSTGYGFGVAQSQCGLVVGRGAADFADINGDGKADYVQYRQGTTTTQSAIYEWHLSTGNGFTGVRSNYLSSSYMPLPVNAGLNGLAFGDVEGDGKNDLIAIYSDASFRPVKAIAGSRLVNSINNGYGKKISVAYLNSAQNGIAHLNNPPPMQTIDRISVDDGRLNVATTTYRFGNGFYDRKDREFRGFGYALVSLPCIRNYAIVAGAVSALAETDCPTVKNWYSLNNAQRNTLIVSERYAGARQTERFEYKYQLRTDALPYRADMTSFWKSRPVSGVCNSAANCEWTITDYVYDVFGNVIEQTEQGDIFASGDERHTRTNYLYATSPKLIVDRPGSVSVHAGTSSLGMKMSETVYCYDQSGVTAPNCALLPSRGNPTTVKRWLKEESRYISSHTSYNLNGSIAWVRDALGNQTTYGYDTADPSLLRTATNAKSQIHTTAWNHVCQQPILQTDYNGVNVESIQYDAFCRLKRKDMPQGDYIAKSYCAPDTTVGNNVCGVVIGGSNGQHVMTEFPNATGNATPAYVKSYFDGFEREIEEQKLTSQCCNYIEVTSKSYNLRGQLALIQRHYSEAETYFSYDQLDRNTSIVNAGILKTPVQSLTLSYTQAGRTTLTNASGNVSHLIADAYGRTAKEQKVYDTATTYETRYVYDALGRRIEVYDAENNRWTDTYDSLGRKTSSRDPDRGTTGYWYNDNDLLQTRIDAKGQATCFYYDALNRLYQRSEYCGSTQARAAVWTYDGARAGYANVGHLTSEVDLYTGVRADYDYDSAGRLVNEIRTIGGVSYPFAYGYDARGNRKWTSFPDGDTLGTPASPILYDSAGRVSSIPGYLSTVWYNDWGGVTFYTAANGVSTYYTYDVALRLASLKTMRNGAYLQDLAYSRYADGNIYAIASPIYGESWNYDYDRIGRLTYSMQQTAGVGGNPNYYTYSPSGNITSTTAVGIYSYPVPGTASVRPHAAGTAGSQTFGYDANGSMTLRNGVTMGWDGLNRLTSVGSTRFVYDVNGERVQKVDPVTGTTTYVKPDYQVKNGVVTKHITLNGQTIARKIGGVVNWIHNDHLGSVNVITDALGNEVVRYRHKPYGQRIDASNATPEETDFLGERRDTETGLLYQRARYYDPVIGRYTSADPWDPQITSVGPNRYAYAGNDPVNYWDDGNQSNPQDHKLTLPGRYPDGKALEQRIAEAYYLPIYHLLADTYGKYVPLANELIKGAMKPDKEYEPQVDDAMNPRRIAANLIGRLLGYFMKKDDVKINYSIIPPRRTSDFGVPDLGLASISAIRDRLPADHWASRDWTPSQSATNSTSGTSSGSSGNGFHAPSNGGSGNGTGTGLTVPGVTQPGYSPGWWSPGWTPSGNPMPAPSDDTDPSYDD